MAEVLTIIGVIASCNQILQNLTTLNKNLRKAYKSIRFAKKDVEIIKNRTWIIIKLWRFFRQCLRKVSKIKEFSPDFERYMNIHQSLERQAREVNHKIKAVLNGLYPLWTSEPMPAWKEWYAKITWLMRNQEDIRLLFVDMDLLIQFMQVYILLLQLQICVQQYNLSSSAATKVQVTMLEGMIVTNLRGLHRIQQSQQTIRSNERPVVSDKETDFLLQEIRAIVRQEVSQLPMRSAGNNHPNSAPSSRSTQESTVPFGLNTSLPSNPIQPDEMLNLPESQYDAVNSRHSIPFNPSSFVSYESDQGRIFSMDLAVSDNVNREGYLVNNKGMSRNGEGDEENRERPVKRGGMYVPTALFRSPEGRHEQT